MMIKVLSLACLLALCYSLPSPAEKKGEEKCTIEGKQGICVPFYLCERPADTADASAGLIDIHIPVEPECESYSDLCCEAKFVSKAPPSAKEPVKA